MILVQHTVIALNFLARPLDFPTSKANTSGSGKVIQLCRGLLF